VQGSQHCLCCLRSVQWLWAELHEARERRVGNSLELSRRPPILTLIPPRQGRVYVNDISDRDWRNVLCHLCVACVPLLPLVSPLNLLLLALISLLNPLRLPPLVLLHH